MAKWEKVLYKQQPFPDNYTPNCFLDEVVLNAHVKERHYWTVVRASGTVVQQMCTVCISVCISYHLYQENIEFELMTGICAAALLSGFVLCCVVGGHVLGGTLYRAVRQCVLLTSGVFFLSPLLQTLTETISTDTIIALICLLLIVHLYFHDYKYTHPQAQKETNGDLVCSFVNSVTDKFTGSVSLGCAIFSSVLISSRMQRTQYVFVQNLFSMEMYLLFPFARRYILQSSRRTYHLLTFAFVAASLVLTQSFSSILSVLLVLLLTFVSLICPLFLVKMHKFKAKINGPWDEAVPQIRLKLQNDSCRGSKSQSC